MADITMCSGERCPLRQICYDEVNVKTDKNDEKSTNNLT
jgi:hypothetical protein